MNKIIKPGGKAIQKALSVICLLCLLLSFGTVPASAAGTAKITTSSCQAERGASVSVTLTLEGNPGMYAMMLNVGYDSSALTLISASNGSVFSDEESVMGELSANPLQFTGYASGTQNTNANGTVLTLDFTVNSGAAFGSYPVTVSLAKAFTDSYDNFAVDAANGSVTVVNCIHANKEWRVTTAATCETAGTETLTCKKCEDTFEKRTIAATGHKNTEIRNAVAPTKTAEGYSGDTYCKDCKKIISKGKKLAKLTENTTSKPSAGNGDSKPASTTDNSNTESTTSKPSDENDSSKDAQGSEPVITAGKNSVFNKDSDKPLVFVSDADLSELIRVEIDGTTLNEKDYTAKSGSTIISINADCLNKLGKGEHEVSIVSESGTATAKFTIKDKAAATDTEDKATSDKKSSAPKTIFLIVIILCAVGIIGFFFYKERGRR